MWEATVSTSLGRRDPAFAERWPPSTSLRLTWPSGPSGAAGGCRGAFVERKKFTVAIHFRLVAQALRSRVEEAVDAVHAEQPTLRKEGGKAVFELRPDLHWDKGTAVLWLLEKMGLDHVLPIHIGDDLTDETVFGALGDGGIGIVVTDERRQTAAQFTLRDPGDVARFLSVLTRMLRREPR